MKKSTTLSARFEPDELAMLRQAAEKKGWSVSQLLKNGAYEKAVSIINAHNPAVGEVRVVLGKMMKQLFDAEVWVKVDKRSGESFDTPFNESIYSLAIQPMEDEVNVELYATKLPQATINKVIRAIRLLGAEIVPLLEEELMRATPAPTGLDTMIDPTESRGGREYQAEAPKRDKAPHRQKPEPKRKQRAKVAHSFVRN